METRTFLAPLGTDVKRMRMGNGEVGLKQDATLEPAVTITVCENGPLIVRGDYQLTTTEREPIESDRNVIALCRCGRSTIRPFCDGTHYSVYRSIDRGANTSSKSEASVSAINPRREHYGNADTT